VRDVEIEREGGALIQTIGGRDLYLQLHDVIHLGQVHFRARHGIHLSQI
jgi:hypothetical protein